MKIVFIQPKGYPLHPERAYEPLNLGYLAAYLQQNGDRDIKIHICAYERDRDVTKDAATSNIVGITATSPMMTHGKALAKQIKKINPQAVIVFGGSHPSALPESTLDDKNIDVVVRGEGEVTVFKLVEAIERGGSLETIPGVSYKLSGKIVHNPNRELIQDIDTIPYPARDLLMQERFTKRFYRMFGQRSAWVLSSRGCPFQCSYCASKCVWGRKWRARSPQNIIGEIEELIDKYGINRVDFADDTFTVSKNRILSFCELLKKNKIGISWGCNVHANTIDKEMLEAMKATGCKEIWIGVESGSPRILKELKKGTDIAKIREAFKVSKEVGLPRRAYLMIGSPSENLETIRETEALIDEIKPDYAGFTILTPFPGCELYAHARKMGFIPDDVDWSAIEIYNKATMPTEYLSKEELNRQFKRLSRSVAYLEKKKRFSLSYLIYRGWIEVRATPLIEYPSLFKKFWIYLKNSLFWRSSSGSL